MAEATLASPSIPHFLAKQVEAFAKKEKRAVEELDLAKAITEVEIQRQILGASFIKVHIDDPEWEIITSGLIRVDEDGLLDEVEVEFPEGSGSKWMLAAVEGSTEIAQANLVLTFEDIVVAELRRRWGHRTFPPGLTTRAQVVKALVDEANLKGKLNPPIRFVSRGLNRKEPVEESTKEKKEKLAGAVKTEAVKKGEEIAESRTQGIHAGAEFKIKGATPTAAQRTLATEVLTIANELNSGPLATEALTEACIDENDFTNNPGGGGGSTGLLQLIPSTAAGLGIDPLNVKQCVTAFLKQGFAGNGGAIEYAKAHPSAPAYEVAQAIQGSGAGAASKGQANYGQFQQEAQEIIHAFGGITPGGGTTKNNESDVGQLSRGTPQNPDEDSWDCITRLAQQVDWNAFTDGHNTLFYMDGHDFMAQKPSLYIDVKSNRVVREVGGEKDLKEGQLIRPLTFQYDNTAFLYRATHKVKAKLQRKSRISKPQTPSEVRMLMLCEIDEYRAGDVFVFKNSGPISENSGRWIVSDATRECIAKPYTQFILVPPTEPLPEPKAEAGTTEPNSATKSALSAFEASNMLSQMGLPYLWGGGHEAGGLDNVKAGGHGLDCSGSVCYVLKQAGMFSASAAQVSGELESFGEAGEGKEMTIWASPNHAYIEFNIPGHEPAQMNTNGPQNGPRLYTLSQTPTYNGPKGTGSGGPFVARHFHGT